MTERAPRTFVDSLAEAWNTASEPLWIGAAAIGLVQAVMMARLAGASIAVPLGVAVVLGAVGVAALLARRRFPLVVALIESGIVAIAGLGGIDNYYAFPLLMSVYALAARGRAWQVALGTIAATLASAVGASHVPQTFFPRIVPVLFAITVLVGVALGFRARRAQLAGRDRELQADARRLQLTEQRDAVRRQARIAGELHDAVGHNLTAIIALSEGLRDSTQNPALNEAIATINILARDGLADTRRAVTELQPLPDRGAAEASGSRGEAPAPHSWDDLDALVRTTRATGLVVALTETGSRPADPTLAEATFTVVREALTNVMRHAKDATRATVALQHDDGATVVTVSDDGQGRVLTASPDGHGLGLLRELAAERGGDVLAGPTDNGWRLVVTLGGGAG